jgi:transposase
MMCVVNARITGNGSDGMPLETILNRLHKFKSFVYGKVVWKEPGQSIDVHIRPRKNSRPVCSSCRQPGPVYDHQPEARRFEFVPLWGLAVFFVYRMRRVNCRTCGRVVVEQVPWGDGKHRTTTTYRWFLADWAKRLSWQEVAVVFKTSWQTVFRSVQYAVHWGIANDQWHNVVSLGIDEIAWRKGHKYLTLVYQIDEGRKRLLFIAQERTKAALHQFFDLMRPEQIAALKFVVSDMWPNYLDVVRDRAGKAVHILDRFHVMKKLNEAVDQVRRDETRRLKTDGYEPVLKKTRWCLLKRPENLSDRQTVALKELLTYNLRTVRAWLLREDFQRFWDYRTAGWAGRFLDEWVTRTMRSRLDPMKKVARSLRTHRPLLLNWFRARGSLSAGVVEGFNGKAKLTMKKAYGYRTPDALQVALYHTLGKLPQPDFTHRFW